MTGRIKLHFEKPKRSELDSPPVYLYVAKGGVDSYGFQMLSSEICGESDLDIEINALIEDLEEIRKKGKHRFNHIK